MSPKRKATSSAPRPRARPSAAPRVRIAARLPEGEWVALVEGEVVAHASSYKRIESVVRELGLESRVILSRVLPKGPVIY